METFITCEYKVVNHVAGIRPTVVDRRPLIGGHPEYSNLFILNGFGSRGVLIGPQLSHELYKYIEEDDNGNDDLMSNLNTKSIK